MDKIAKAIEMNLSFVIFSLKNHAPISVATTIIPKLATVNTTELSMP